MGEFLSGEGRREKGDGRREKGEEGSRTQFTVILSEAKDLRGMLSPQSTPGHGYAVTTPASGGYFFCRLPPAASRLPSAASRPPLPKKKSHLACNLAETCVV